MSEISKEIIKQMVMEEQFSNTKEIMETIKWMFQEVLQEAMKTELEDQFGYKE